MLFIILTPVLNRHLWQLKTAVFQHWCLIRALLSKQTHCIPLSPQSNISRQGGILYLGGAFLGPYSKGRRLLDSLQLDMAFLSLKDATVINPGYVIWEY